MLVTVETSLTIAKLFTIFYWLFQDKNLEIELCLSLLLNLYNVTGHEILGPNEVPGRNCDIDIF